MRKAMEERTHGWMKESVPWMVRRIDGWADRRQTDIAWEGWIDGKTGGWLNGWNGEMTKGVDEGRAKGRGGLCFVMVSVKDGFPPTSDFPTRILSDGTLLPHSFFSSRGHRIVSFRNYSISYAA